MRPRLRFAILRRDDFRCIYCGKSGTSALLHVDHIVAASKGGEDHSDNLVTACIDCNGGKADGPPVLIAFAHAAARRAENNYELLSKWRRAKGLSDPRHDRAFRYVAEATSSPIDVGMERWEREVSWWIFPPDHPAGLVSPIEFDDATFELLERCT